MVPVPLLMSESSQYHTTAQFSADLWQRPAYGMLLPSEGFFDMLPLASLSDATKARRGLQ